MNEVLDSEFEAKVLQSDLPVLVDFWAPWCGPCQSLAPTLDEIAGEYSEKVTVLKMNVDENANIPVKYGVRSIPFVALFHKGELVDSVVGAVPKAKLVDLVNKAVPA